MSSMRLRQVLLVSLLVLCASGLSPALAFTRIVVMGVGTKVVCKYQTQLKIGNQFVDAGGVHRIYTVENAQGAWILIGSSDVRGWVQASQVIPFDRAIDFYSGEIRRAPRSPQAYFQRGLIWGDKHEIDLAIGDFSTAIQLDPSNKTSYLARGLSWRDKGDNPRAIADFSEAIRLDPNYARAYGVRGFAWIDKKEYEIAIADFSEVVRIQPANFQAYIDRGLAWDRKGEFDKAIADYNESIRHEPNNPWAYNDRGNARRAKGELDLALADYEEAAKLDPSFVWAFINRGLAWAAKRDYDRALVELERALAVEPKNAYVFNNRAVVWAKKGDYEQAREDFDEAIRLDPKFSAPRAGLALMLATCPDAKFRNGARAVALATDAVAGASAADPFPSSVLAAAFAESGDFARAVEWQEKALQLMPDSRDKDEHRSRLTLYQTNKPFRQEPKP